MDWNTELVDQLESHWHDRLRPRLDGLSDEEYVWEPVPDCLTVRRRGTGTAAVSWGSGDFTMDAAGTGELEPVATIAWRLAHLVVGLAETNGTHFGGPPTDPETFAYAGTAAEALRQLDETHDRWIAGVRSLGEEGLARPQGPTQPPAFADAPMARLVMYVHVEVIHHGAEICLLRDLYLRTSA